MPLRLSPPCRPSVSRYRALDANVEKDLVEKYGVRQAPTLIVLNGDSFEKFRGVSDIKGWLMSR